MAENERPPIRYLLVPKDGIDVLHRDPGEQCQMDDTENEESIDASTYEAMKAGGHARLCRHCHPQEDPS